jgi:hypothetical protein
MAGRPSTQPFAPGTRFGEHAPRDWYSITGLLAVALEERFAASGERVRGPRGAPQGYERMARDQAVSIASNLDLDSIAAFAEEAVDGFWRLDVSLAGETEGPPYRVVRNFLALHPDPTRPARAWAVVVDDALLYSDVADVRRGGIKLDRMLDVVRPFVTDLPTKGRIAEIPPCPRHLTPTAEHLRKALASGAGLRLEREVARVAAGDPDRYGDGLGVLVARLRRGRNVTSLEPAVNIIRHPLTYLDESRAQAYQSAMKAAASKR